MEQKTDYVSEGLGRLLTKLQDNAELKALLESFLTQVQAFENGAYPILTERDLTQATGQRLDWFGQLLNLARGNRNDTDYRAALQFELLVLNSQGTVEELIDIANAMATPTAWIFTELYPKTFFSTADNYAWPLTGTQPDIVSTTLRRASPAGCASQLIYSRNANSTTYELADGDGDTLITSDSSQGLAAAPSQEGAWVYDSESLTRPVPLGVFRFNSTNISAATELYIHESDFTATPRTTWLDTLTPGKRFIVDSNTGGAESATFQLSSQTDHGSDRTLRVVALTAAQPWTDNDVFVFDSTASGGFLAQAI